jgi:hypothetical protein
MKGGCLLVLLCSLSVLDQLRFACERGGEGGRRDQRHIGQGVPDIAAPFYDKLLSGEGTWSHCLGRDYPARPDSGLDIHACAR